MKFVLPILALWGLALVGGQEPTTTTTGSSVQIEEQTTTVTPTGSSVPEPTGARPKLRGVTINNWPYIRQHSNGSFSGVLVDMMDAMAAKIGFDYELYLEPSRRYGIINNDSSDIDGMLGEVYHKRADFALADITRNTEREQFVDFTLCFLKGTLSALIRKDLSLGIMSLDHLIRVNLIPGWPELLNLDYGVLRGGSTRQLLSASEHPLAQKLNEYFLKHPDQMTNSTLEGYQKAKEKEYAFIGESWTAEYHATNDCEMRVLYDTVGINPPVEYAIALPKNSTYRELFSNIILDNEIKGITRKMLRKYWFMKPED